MTDEFDAYHVWLGIPPQEQPPNHYRLLGIPVFEDNPDVITHAADRQMGHVRAVALKHHALSQAILNQISTARICLLRSESKAAYDEQLRQDLSPAAEATSRSGMRDPVIAASPADDNPSPIGADDISRASSAAASRDASLETGLALSSKTIFLTILGGLLLVAGAFWWAGSGKKKVPTVGSKPAAVPPAPATPNYVVATERRIAEWVLNNGGELTVVTHPREQEVKVAIGEAPPDGSFFVQRVQFRGAVGMDGAKLGRLNELARLEGLELPSCAGIDDEAFKHLPKLRTLRWLNVTNTRVGNKGLIHLRHNERLRSLYLSGAGINDDIVDALNLFPRLEKLAVYSNDIKGRRLGELKWRNRLRHVELYSRSVTKATMSALALMPNLKYLHVRGGVKVEQLAWISQMPQVETVVLSSPGRLTAAGCEGLAGMQRLQRLDLIDVAIGEQHVAGLAKLQNVRFLNLVRTRTSAATLKKIGQALPRCALQAKLK